MHQRDVVGARLAEHLHKTVLEHDFLVRAGDHNQRSVRTTSQFDEAFHQSGRHPTAANDHQRSALHPRRSRISRRKRQPRTGLSRSAEGHQIRLLASRQPIRSHRPLRRGRQNNGDFGLADHLQTSPAEQQRRLRRNSEAHAVGMGGHELKQAIL